MNFSDFKKYVESQSSDKRWVRSGEVISAGSTLYGYRVDNVLMTTYQTLHAMNRDKQATLNIIEEKDE